MQTFSQKLCRVCLSTMLSQGQDALSASLKRSEQELKAARQVPEPYAPPFRQGAREETKHGSLLIQGNEAAGSGVSVQSLKSWIPDSLSCMRPALTALQVKGGTGAPDADDRITFFAAWTFLEHAGILYLPTNLKLRKLAKFLEDQRILVLLIVKDKLQQIIDGNASASFVEELKSTMGLAPAPDVNKLEAGKANPICKRHAAVVRPRFIGTLLRLCALDVGRAECEHQAAARAALRQAEEDRSHAKELQQDLEKCRRELFALKAELAESERSRQLEGMEKLRHLGLQPEEANFVLSELELSDAGAAREVREVLFDGTPEDCTSECIMRWHRESGLGADSLIAVQIQPGFDSEGHAQSSGSVVCTYDKRADAEEAVMTLQDTVLTSASGKQS
ncbi:unnamed protein product, partial [Symbiodinium natans]